MAGLTGLMVLAGSGMLKDDSIQVSPELGDLVTQYSSSNLTSLIQSHYTSGNQDVKDALSLAPHFLSGLPPAGMTLPSGFTTTNIVQSVKDHADSIVANGAKGFASVFGQSSGHAATAFGFSGALAQGQGRKFDDMGFAFSNYDDVISGGVSNQFNVTYLPVLAKEIVNFGTMFSTRDLYNMTNPGSVCSNLIDQGLGNVGNLRAMLEEEGLNLEDLTSENPTVIKNVMSRIKGSDLDEIISTTNFVPAPGATVLTLADIFKIDNLLTSDAQRALGNGATVDDLSRKFSNIGGKFTDVTALGKLYSTLELTSFPRLRELGALVPDGMEIDLSSSLGTGSGELGNPTMADMIGSVGGIGYNIELKQMIDLQARLLATDSDVQALAQYLTSNTSLNVTTLGNLISNINSKPGLIDPINQGEAAMIHVTERLSVEKGNIDVAAVDVSKQATPQGVVSMAGNLHGYGVDPMSLGLGSVIEGSVKDNVYGDAMKASLVEGRNLGRLTVFGIKSGTKMDAMDYAKSLKTVST